MEHLKDPGVILGGIDLIAIGVVYSHLQRQISSIKETNTDDIRKNLEIIGNNIKALNNQNVILADHINKLTARLDALENKNVVSKGDKKRAQVSEEESSDSEEEQTDEDIVISLAKGKIKNNSPN